jgi:hypothetical protein
MNKIVLFVCEHLLTSARVAAAVAQVRRVKLSALSALVLKHNLPKDSAVRCSNWGRPTLTANQIEYASLDAYATLAVYQSLDRIDPGFEPGIPGTFELKCISIAALRGRGVRNNYQLPFYLMQALLMLVWGGRLCW